ncbi:GNAT family N-acetyltransferase [Cellulomonas sp. NPDC055163]
MLPDERVETVRLRPLLPSDEAEATAAHRELAADGFEFLLGFRAGDDWAAHLERLAHERAGADLPEGRVPATYLVAEVNGRIVGRVSVRHSLNEHLAHVGGHIGYAVRPAHRGRGYATAMLRRALGVAGGAGVDVALVTCSETNVASARVVERCGGVLVDVVDAPEGPQRRYHVPTTS